MAGQALYYGMNALSPNVIMADRKKLKSANGMYLGSTSSGKSFAAKRELLNVFLTIPQDHIGDGNAVGTNRSVRVENTAVVLILGNVNSCLLYTSRCV